LNGRFVSNEYLQTLTVIHPQQMDKLSSVSSSSEIDVQVRPQDSHRKIGVHGVEQPVFSMSSHTPSNSGFAGNQEQSNITAMIVVVCVGLMIAFLILGIIRLRAVHNRQTKEELQAEVEMAWDDSALNITVNPIDEAENCQKVAMVAEVTDLRDQFLDSSDEEDMMAEDDLYQEDDEEEDEVDEDSDEEIGLARHGGRRARLEWDNDI